MPPRTYSPTAPLLLALGLAACDSVTAPPSGDAGTFSASITGLGDRVVSGHAVFTADVAGPEYGFAIALLDSVVGGREPAVRHAVYLYREEGGAPARGSYAVSPQAPFRAGVVLDGDGDDPLLCTAESGTLRITSVGPAEVRGSFDLEARCAHVDGAEPSDAIQASGLFTAEDGVVSVPDDVTEPPTLEGRFELVDAAGSPLPALIFEGMVPIGDDQLGRLRITATGGHFELDGSGSYEHRVDLDVLVDGHPAPSLDWVDRGTCISSDTRLDCASTLVANRTLSADVTEDVVETTQDLTGEGLAVTYRYVRNPPPGS